MSQNYKVIFRLDQDEDGYPPAAFEGLWATVLPNGNFKIDSIPFYVLGISGDDEIEVDSVNDELWFRSLVGPSKNSTFRLLFSNKDTHVKVREELNKLGCKSEYNQKIGLVAVEIPENTAIKPFLNYILDGQKRGEFDFEEAALRHSVN